MPPGTTSLIAEFASTLEYKDLPADVIKSVKLYLLDTLGCGFYGSGDNRSRILTDKMIQLEGIGNSSIWNRSEKASPGTASLLNGTFVHAMDFDDQCMEVGLHAGSCVVPPSLAATSILDSVDGRSFLTALTAGYESSIRIGSSFGLDPVRRGWHIAGFNGTFGSAISVGKLLNLDYRGMMNAIGLAATQGAGLMSVQYGSDAKGMHSGKAAQSGLYSAQLASGGFKGIENVLEIPYGGYNSTLADRYDLGKVTEGLGDRYLLMERLAVKAYPGVRMVHTSIEAADEIISGENIGAEDIDSVRVLVTKIGKEHVGWDYEPRGITSALSNLKYGVASMIVRGSVDVNSYTEDAIRDPETLRMIKKVDVLVDEDLEARDPYSMGSTVEINLRNGGKFVKTISDPKGTPITRPLTRDEIVRKFRGLTEGHGQADEIIRFVDNLEKMDDVSDLNEMLSSER